MTKSIGIFDSGLGGLTVLKELSTRFPNESFCYLGDIARLPYGNKSPETIRRYGMQILKFLKEQNVKALIIACNSASTVFLGENEFEGIPLLNVIEPGSAAALKVSQDKKIAVLGTSATVRSHAYLETLKRLDASAEVYEQACPLLVPLVEEGWVHDPVTQLVAERYLHEIKKEEIKTVILGCTHYPVLKPDLRKVLGDDVHLVESGEVLAQQLENLYQQKVLERDTGTRQIRICITDLTDHFERLARVLMHPEPIGPLEKVVL
ncbi:glutamate racemase [Peredibacter starrii]|uniref:Glutamate racemase n=1 Tax=Peredibacter starrii TaxID=28202 RepID=A0AAX4HMT5_9BACT|nr:glutamate racemase [Peredibacter starrii]WPU64194.1 glutamate racemase [Peredibacter starrii]